MLSKGFNFALVQLSLEAVSKRLVGKRALKIRPKAISLFMQKWQSYFPIMEEFYDLSAKR